MDANDNEGFLYDHGALTPFASNRASTGCSYNQR
ncbi:hypothetical protein PS659_02091 [Pseudomonas fluorescens]|uniref:Uncharacterized protein n=1 Tax=Pseudomonas fluorescens TaxID=294 RepID=A0A5E6S5Q9_PSEFL|nr:hypothetical protein PS659_02091 [Pseudomonas fluorescens]